MLTFIQGALIFMIAWVLGFACAILYVIHDKKKK